MLKIGASAPYVVDGACAPANKVLSPSHETIARPKMGQQLTMTPQLQQAIRLLQLSTLTCNKKSGSAGVQSDARTSGRRRRLRQQRPDGRQRRKQAGCRSPREQLPESTSSAENLEEGEWNERIPNELPVDTAWEDIYQTSASNLPASDDDEWDFTTRTSVGESLQSHLLWQLNLAPMSDTDRLIAVTLIDSINEQGYPEDSPKKSAQASTPNWISSSTKSKRYCTASSNSNPQALAPAALASACCCSYVSFRRTPLDG